MKPYTLPTYTNLNLDSMDASELKQFAKATRKTRLAAKAILADKYPVYGCLAMVEELHAFAWNKLIASGLRLDGCIEEAIGYERVCDLIHNRLHPLVKW